MARSRHLLILIVLAATLAGTALATAWQQSETRLRKVKRVRRPIFTPRDWEGVYFENLYRDALVGSRPDQVAPVDRPLVGVDSEPPMAEEGESAGWSALVPGFILEDEIKKLQQLLGEQITSPAKFRSDYGTVRQSLEMLSLLFAVIREYEGEVRWQDEAGLAQATFARSAANARVGTQQAFQSAQRSRDALAALVRGEKFESSEEIPESLEWPRVVDRNSLMIRLEAAVGVLRPAIANEREFSDQQEAIEHQACLIAMIGDVLVKEGMEAADEEDYAIHSLHMRDAARLLAAAARDGRFEAAAAPFNTLSQSCSDCHQEWR